MEHCWIFYPDVARDSVISNEVTITSAYDNIWNKFPVFSKMDYEDGSR